MDKVLRRMIATLVLILACAASGDAQNTCTGTTIGDCYFEGYKVGVGGAVAKEEGKDVRRMPAGPTTAAAGLGSSTTDYLNPLQFLVQSAISEDEGQALALDLGSALVPYLGKNFKLQMVARPPELFAGAKEALEEAQVAEVEEGLEDLDDLSYELAWTLTNERYGRDVDQHRAFVTDLTKAVIGPASKAEALIGPRFFDALDRLVQEVESARAESTEGEGEVVELGDIGHQTSFAELRLKPETEADVRRALFEAGSAVGSLNESIRSGAETNGIFLFSRLVNNQPQIELSASHRDRQGFAGPDETSVKFSLEAGLVNVNWLRRRGGTDLAHYRSLLVDDERARRLLQASYRGELSIEYSDIDDFSEPLGDQKIEVPGSGRTLIALTGSRLLFADPEAADGARLDLRLAWEDSEEKGMRQGERLLGSLTYTQKLADGTSGVVGLVWADKPEFLGEVDHELSARFGLIFKTSKPGE